MFSAIYIESEVRDHPRSREILARYRGLPHIECERYGEIFNRKSQNFRLQKENPALILARKHGHKVLPAPGGYGFDATDSHYFSHMLNCVYDCRYCFLQGMYRSAHCVLFVNYEDFTEAIEQTIESGPDGQVFYSGYDCDSLALEPVSGFASHFLPLFARHPGATLELRTKSTQIAGLLRMPALPNCIIAMSFTTAAAAARWEQGVPSISKRLAALARLQQAGWPIALRFEPLLPGSLPEGDTQAYEKLFKQIFSELDAKRLHSVSTGDFRMPTDYFRNTLKLYPDEPLFARETRTQNGLVTLLDPNQQAHLKELESILLPYINRDNYYRCE